MLGLLEQVAREIYTRPIWSEGGGTYVAPILDIDEVCRFRWLLETCTQPSPRCAFRTVRRVAAVHKRAESGCNTRNAGRFTAYCMRLNIAILKLCGVVSWTVRYRTTQRQSRMQGRQAGVVTLKSGVKLGHSF